MHSLIAFYCEYSWTKLIPYVLLLSLSLFLQTFTLNLNINSKWYQMFVQTSNKHSQVYYVRPKNPFLFSQLRNTLYHALTKFNVENYKLEWRYPSYLLDIFGFDLLCLHDQKNTSFKYVPLMCCYHLYLH